MRKRKFGKIINCAMGIMISASMLFGIVAGATETAQTNPTSQSETTPGTNTNETGGNGNGERTSYSSDGTAMGRIKVFLRKAAGKNVVSDNDAISNMSQNDLKFLGVYLSNFFIPYGTEFAMNSGLTEENLSELSSALMTNLKFDEDTAKSLANIIIGLSKANNQELVFCVSSEYQKELIKLDDVVLNEYTLIQAMSGRLPKLMGDRLPNMYTTNLTKYAENRYLGKYPDQKKDRESETEQIETEDTGNPPADIANKTFNLEQNIRIIAPIWGSTTAGSGEVFESSLSNAYSNIDSRYPEYSKQEEITYDNDPLVKDKVWEKKSYNYGYLAYKNGESYTPVFDFNLYEEDGLTACQYAYWKCLESVPFEQGYGMNLFDFSKTECDNDGYFKDVDSKFSSDTQWYAMSAMGSRVLVDCFGNIHIKGANHMFIAVPGCVNPYTWQAVNADGTDDTDNPAGSVYNMVNMLTMGIHDNNRFIKNVSGDRVKEGSMTTQALANRLKDMGDTFRVYRGNTTEKLKTGWLFMKDSSAENAMKHVRNGAIASGDYCIPVDWRESVPKVDAGLSKVRVLLPHLSSTPELQYGSKNKLKFMDSIVYIDNLGAYGFDNSQNDIDWEKFKTFNVDNYVSPKNDAFKDMGTSLGTGFSTIFESVEDGKLTKASESDKNTQAVVMVYVSYAFAGVYDSDSKAEYLGKIGYRMGDSVFPDIEDTNIGDVATGEDLMITSIKEWLYYLLHPTKGQNYVTTLISNKARALVVSWHNDMLGTKGVGNITGTTKYRGNVGYVSTPELTEIEWTAKLLDFWEGIVPFVVVVGLVVFAFVYLAGILSLQGCILGVVCFAICLVVPVRVINGAVNMSNRIVSNIYGERFTYWAMVQHESYADAIDEAASGTSYSNYLKTLYSQNSAINVNQGSESIKLRWQAPKKMASLMLTSEDNSILNGFRGSIIWGALSNAYDGESYMDNTDATYMYRSYLDISNFSKYIYRGIKAGTRKSRNSLGKNLDCISNLSSDLKKKYKNMDTDVKEYRSSGYANSGSGSGSTASEISYTVPLTSMIYNDALKGKDKIGKLKITDYVGINQDFFNFSIPMFNVGEGSSGSESGLSLKDAMVSSAKSTEFKDLFDKYKEEDYVGLAAYGLYSESVFYYYSWYLYDLGMSPDTGGSGGFKKLLLEGKNGEFFYNTEGNSELKDIMDMRTLFTYIIPYLNAGNDIVRDYDDTYGLKVYSGVSTEEGHEDEYKNDPELRQKYWNNLNVSRLYEIYSPWVDLMYDCEYSKPERIKVLGDWVTVENPMDPSTYPSERPMIFSRSEMTDYGMSEKDLTRVEKKILKCNDDFQEALFELLNYYSFSDQVLNTAAAMECAFIFNKNFSETHLFGNGNIDIYPQSFEISDFSYDAFLRFILSNTTGESMLNTDDFYMNVVQGSSITAGICLIILDIASVYVLPGLKIFFVVLVFLASILSVLISILHVDEEYRFIPRMCRNVILPMFRYFLITVGMAYLISLFMGVGNDSITGSRFVSIQLGDPVMVMIVMMVIDVVAIILYYMTIREVWRSVRSMSRVVGGALSGVVGVLSGAALVTAVSRGFESGAERSKGLSEDGDGVMNSRASERGNSRRSSEGKAYGEDVIERQPEQEDRRVVEEDRSLDTMRDINDTSEDTLYSTNRRDDINNATKNGMSKVRGVDRGDESHSTGRTDDTTSSRNDRDLVDRRRDSSNISHGERVDKGDSRKTKGQSL